ncbi:MAG TPA: dihydroneopterin aldolase [Symbiobacteriaceae bacterium]
MDRIILSGMQFYGYHGVYPEEARLGQNFIVDVELCLDLREAGQHDDLRRTVDYAKVYRLIKEVVEGQPYKLIEAVAERVAARLLAAFPVAEVVVRVHKPNVPIPGALDRVTVEIRRGRS